MNVNVCTEPQQAIDNRATQNLLPATSCWLTQHYLRHLSFAGNLDELFSDIIALRTDDLRTQVFCEHCMLFQSTLGILPVLPCLSAILEQSSEFAPESKKALWLDRDRDQ